VKVFVDAMGRKYRAAKAHSPADSQLASVSALLEALLTETPATDEEISARREAVRQACEEELKQPRGDN
jgi:hypothetical protein